MPLNFAYRENVLNWLLRGGAPPSPTHFAWVGLAEGVGGDSSFDFGTLGAEPWHIAGYARQQVTWGPPQPDGDGYVCVNTNRIVFPIVAPEQGDTILWNYGLFNSATQGAPSSSAGHLTSSSEVFSDGAGVVIAPGELVFALDR